MAKKVKNQTKKSKNTDDSVKKEKKRVFFQKGWKRKIFLRFLLCLTGAIFIYVLYCIATLPDIEKAIKNTRAPKMYILAADGSEIAFYGSKYGRPVSLKNLPSHVTQAIIATEDKRFYSHFGIDLRSVLRALSVNLIKGSKAQGASTLTQQVAKNLFLSSEKTFKRKVQELLLALWLEYNLTKDQILTIYLNRVYFGSGTYGIEAAAQKYYGVKAKDLSMYQAAVLAGVLKAPSRYNPLTHPERANERARLVLANMVKAGFVSALKALDIAETGVKTQQAKNKSVFYFTDWIADETEAYLGSVGQDIIVKTTLIPSMQETLNQKIVQALDSDKAKNKKVGQAAGIVMDENGAVLAMVGGKDYEPHEENPMIGYRGASRYYSEQYRQAFEWECQALAMVRNEMGFSNMKIMIPFLRTPEEGRRVLEIMRKNGLVQGENGLEIYVMCELPVNVILADEFLQLFDGFSIGSNDLTQLTLGVDRDGELVSHVFDERNPALLKMFKMSIEACKRHNKYCGICGQAPSDYPEIAEFLVENGITSISLNPDSVIETWDKIVKLEKRLGISYIASFKEWEIFPFFKEI